MTYEQNPNRRYRFAKHGRSEVFYRSRRALASRRHEAAGTPQTGPAGTMQPADSRTVQPAVTRTVQPAAMSFAQVADHEHLLSIFQRLSREAGEAPGVDGWSYSDFGRSEVAGVLRVVSGAIKARTYRPNPVRSVPIPKAGGRRELSLATVIDRVVATAVKEAIEPVIDPTFQSTSYGFRPGRGVLPMLADMEREMINRNHWVLAIDDVKAAFPSVDISDALGLLQDHITDPELMHLTEVVVRGHDKGRRHGLHQGNATSPLLLNETFNHRLDLPFSAGPGNPLQHRYADNLACVCGSVSEGYSAIQRTRKILSTTSFQLKGEDGQPTDLRRQGAHVDLLGFRISMQDSRLKLKIAPKGWSRLAEALERAHTAQDPVLAAQLAIQGWIAWNGAATESAEEHVTISRIAQTAARYGFREIGGMDAVQEELQKARARWMQVRGGVSLCR